MLKRFITVGFIALFSLSVSTIVSAKGSTLISGNGKPIKSGSGTCVKVTKAAKTDFHYSACHDIKPRKV